MAVTIVERTVAEFMRTEKLDAYEKEVKWKIMDEEKEPSYSLLGTNNWKHQVVTKGWRVTPAQMQLRRKLMKLCCYAKVMKKMFSDKEPLITFRTWPPATEKALRELTSLRDYGNKGTIGIGTRPRTWAEIVRDNTTEPTSDAATQGEPEVITERKPQRQYEMLGERNKRQQLHALWMEFAYSERHKVYWFDRMTTMGKDRCVCRKSRIGYPHWPPTSTDETTAQFELCRNEDNMHGKNLVIRWWSFFNDIANIRPWKMSEPQQRYVDAERLIRENSKLVQKELERSTTVRKKRAKGWGCREYCEEVLKERRCSCLCHCEEHRDECPIHSY